MARIPTELISKAREKLNEAWENVAEGFDIRTTGIPTEILDAIERAINSKTKTYRYVLPTQIVAVAVNGRLDCRSVQATSHLTEPFDARSVCDQVIVPFDRENHNVLGGSTEPYANNPLRIPALTRAARRAQKNKAGFDDLLKVLDFTHAGTIPANLLFRAVLAAVRRRLETAHIVYPVPNRISHTKAIETLAAFLSERTGGIRLQAVAVALFATIGTRFGLFDRVDSSHINAADASTGGAADLECVADDGSIVMAVEAKDRELTLRHAQDKLPMARHKGIRELIFLVQGGTQAQDSEAMAMLIDQEFASGQNLYVCPFEDFSRSCLVLFGEDGRRDFFRRIGEELDQRKAELLHRERWRDLLTVI